MVRTKAAHEKVDPELLRQSVWTVCTLSRQPLEPPVASDALGRLYNKDAIVEHLLQRTQNDPTSSSSPSSPSKTADPIPHIRGLRDITELRLTPNTLYRPPSPTVSTDLHSPYPFMCPLSSKQMDGKQRFVYISTCGCAMSATGLRATITASQTDNHAPCPVCSKPFNAASLSKGKQPEAGGSVITINPSEMEETEMREAMERQRVKQAARRKDKKRTADQALVKGEAQKRQQAEDKSERKRRKAERKAEMSAKIAKLTAELAAE